MRSLWCADGVIAVSDELFEQAKGRVFVDAFEAPLLSTRFLTVEKKQNVNGIHIQSPLGHCIANLNGTHLTVEIADGVFQAELALRLAYHLVTLKLGGILVHGASISLNGKAVLASGKSGDGKSTLSRLCRQAGLTLLTDEVSQLFPDGTVCGTPFRSDEDNVGAPKRAEVKRVLALSKANMEQFDPLSGSNAVQLLLSQRFSVNEFPFAPGEDRKRVMEFLSHPTLSTLAFRKHNEAGIFIREALTVS
jgi:hypothetical protein